MNRVFIYYLIVFYCASYNYCNKSYFAKLLINKYKKITKKKNKVKQKIAYIQTKDMSDYSMNSVSVYRVADLFRVFYKLR